MAECWLSDDLLPSILPLSFSFETDKAEAAPVLPRISRFSNPPTVRSGPRPALGTEPGMEPASEPLERQLLSSTLCPLSSMPMDRPVRRKDAPEGEALRAGDPLVPATAIGRERGIGDGLAAAAAATCATVGAGVGVAEAAGTLMSC